MPSKKKRLGEFDQKDENRKKKGEKEYLGMEVKMDRHAYKNEDAMQAMIERMFHDIEKGVEKADVCLFFTLSFFSLFFVEI